jgi:predicted transcriptional regulator
MEIPLVPNGVRERRTKLGLPLWQLALAAKVSESRLCIIEAGAPPRGHEVEKLAEVFGVTPWELWPTLAGAKDGTRS